jgi:ankyrin repeat protein
MLLRTLWPRRIPARLSSLVWMTALAICPVVAFAGQDDGFSDVPKDHWAYQAVTELKQKGILKGYPVDPADMKHKRLSTALIEAIKRNDTQQVVRLLRSGADTNAHDKPQYGDAFKLPDEKELLPARWYAGASALELALNIGTEHEHITTLHENLTIIKALLDQGADINARDENGTTPLMSAVFIGHIRTIKLLLERGANPRPRDKDRAIVVSGHGTTGLSTVYGSTAMHYAADDMGGNSIRIFQLLLDHGADINARDGYGRTPLSLMASYGQTEAVRFLLGRGAEVNVKDQSGTTALMYAANSHYMDILKALLASGAEVNARDLEGKTALTYSIKPEFSAKVAQLLKQAGATE